MLRIEVIGGLDADVAAGHLRRLDSANLLQVSTRPSPPQAPATVGLVIATPHAVCAATPARSKLPQTSFCEIMNTCLNSPPSLCAADLSSTGVNYALCDPASTHASERSAAAPTRSLHGCVAIGGYGGPTGCEYSDAGPTVCRGEAIIGQRRDLDALRVWLSGSACGGGYETLRVQQWSERNSRSDYQPHVETSWTRAPSSGSSWQSWSYWL